MNTDDTYRKLLEHIIHRGQYANPRAQGTHEVLQHTVEVDMNHPVISIKERELDYAFMAAEAHWILTGKRILDHKVLRKNLEKYSDDGSTMRGAYGPPFIQQLEYCKNVLIADPDSRQAVMSIWERNPRPSKDIPCTVGIQFLIRGGVLNTNVWMRSNDAWLGFPYDIFTFSMMTLMLSLYMGDDNGRNLGILRLTAGSQHLYERHLSKAKNVAACSGDNIAIDIHRFIHPVDLLTALDIIGNAPNDNYNVLRSELC